MESPLLQPDGRFRPLDGVRATAALLIIGFHSVAFNELGVPGGPGGHSLSLAHRFLAQCWIGVDLFFVLSGFLIGRILFLQLQDGRIGFRAFYVRRAFRIFPPYYVMLTLSLFVVAPMSRFAGLYGGASWDTLLRRIPANYLYLNNYLFGLTLDNAMAWSWSLCVEEHFYLLCPALLVLLFRWRKSAARVAVLATLVLVPLSLRALAFARDPQMIPMVLYLESHTHADGLLVGVLIAYLHVFQRGTISAWSARMGPLAWLGALGCFAAVFAAGGTLSRGFFPVVVQFFALAVGGGLVLLNVIYGGGLLARLLSYGWWQPLARYSYGMYLVHPFAIVWLCSVWPGGPQMVLHSVNHLALFVMLAVGLSFGVAALLYLVVERPMIEYGVRLSQPYLTAVAPGGAYRPGHKSATAEVAGLSAELPR